MKKLALFAVAVAFAAEFPSQGFAAAPAAAAVPKSKLCELGMAGYGKTSLPDILADVSQALTKAKCEAGDVVTLVSDEGLALNFVPPAICDYRYEIRVVPGPSPQLFSCVYAGAVRQVSSSGR